MTVYYVRATGNDANDGLSPATAWATNSKALGTGSPVVGGDTIYFGAGYYRGSLSIGIVPTSEVKIYGDPEGRYTGDPGEVYFTSYVSETGDSSTNWSCVVMNNTTNLTFKYIGFHGGASGSSSLIRAQDSATSNIKFDHCYFYDDNCGGCINILGASGAALNWTFESCLIETSNYNSNAINIVLPLAAADYDANVLFQNCKFYGGTSQVIVVSSSGTGAGKGGGVRVRNCYGHGGGTFFRVSSSNASSAGKQCEVYYSALMGYSTILDAGVSGVIVEDYNYLRSSGSVRSNVTAGSHTQAGTAYANMYELGQSFILPGFTPRPHGSPIPGAGQLGYVPPTATPTPPSTDIAGKVRPAGGKSLNYAIGAHELYNTAALDTTVTQTAGSSYRFDGPGNQEFLLPVDATLTTVKVYVRRDSNYGANPLPYFEVVQGGEIGVNDTLVRMSSGTAVNTWEQLTLSFTPTKAGIVTVRIVSQGAGTGKAYFDEFTVS